LRVLYKLRDVAEIPPWGAADDRSLHWFGLTDGAYCIDTVAGRLLEHSDAADPQLGVSWCTYAVVRLFEDLLGALPFIIEPVPGDVVARFFAIDPRSGIPEDEELAAVWFEAHGWWGMRQVDLGYLVGAPRLFLWSSGPNIHLRWRADETWAVQRADVIEASDAFRAMVRGFADSFLGEMRVRVETIARDGWQGRPCRIDIPQLLTEQTEREASARQALSQIARTDWDHVRRMFDILGV
jgi:hypothetical protein